MFLGIRAVLAKSFARIHKANLINFGILPLLFRDPADYDFLETGDLLEFSGLTAKIKESSEIQVHIKNRSRTITVFWELDLRSLDIILAGGLLPFTKRESTDEG